MPTTPTQTAYADLTLLVDGKHAFPEILHCIEQATRSVEINMFIWRDDEIGNRMARAVLDAAERGVTVYISVDRYGVVLEKSEESKRSFFHKKQSLAERIKSRTLSLLYPMKGTPRRARDVVSPLYERIMSHPRITVSHDVFKADHSKYYIIDDELLFVGGINIEDKENGADMQGRMYGDYMVKMVGAAHVNALREKLRTGKCTADGYDFGANIKGDVGLFEMRERYLEIIRSATRELHITMAYFTPVRDFIKEIVRACERGVQVSLLLPEHANYQDASNRRTARRLLRLTKGRIRVYFSPKMLHTKLMFNESVLSLGSTNITKKAFGQLTELNLFLPNVPCPLHSALMESVQTELASATLACDYKTVKYNRLLAAMEGLLL